jgi:hypothetical protein
MYTFIRMSVGYDDERVTATEQTFVTLFHLWVRFHTFLSPSGISGRWDLGKTA